MQYKTTMSQREVSGAECGGEGGSVVTSVFSASVLIHPTPSAPGATRSSTASLSSTYLTSPVYLSNDLPPTSL